MRRTLKSLSILIFATLALILTSCSSGKTKIVEKEVTVTSIVYRDATTTTVDAHKGSFMPNEVNLVQYCFPKDNFCAKFPMFPGADTVGPHVVDPKKIDPPHEGKVFTAYDIDISMGWVDNQLVYCTDILSKACGYDSAKHGVPVDMYGVYVSADDLNGQTFDSYDWNNGDCGGRVNRKVSTIHSNGLSGVKITCGYSYNKAAARTLYYFRFGGKVYEVNASNQTSRPHFESVFLGSFRAIKS